MSWPPLPEALTIAADADPHRNEPGSARVEHTNEPFAWEVKDAGLLSLQEAAYQYLLAVTALAQVTDAFQLPAHWVPALAPTDPDKPTPEPHFGWVPADRDETAPYASLLPKDGSGGMLFASERYNRTAYLGSGFGLAVPVHLRTNADTGKLEAIFTGFAATLPYGVFWDWPLSPDRGFIESLTLPRLLSNPQALLAVRTAGFPLVAFDGARVARPAADRHEVELFGLAAQTEDAQGVPYVVAVQGTVEKDSGTFSFMHLSPMMADAAVPGSGSVFVDDPSSYNPQGKLVRPTADLASYRTGANFGNAATVPLQYSVGNLSIKVLRCPRFVRADRGQVGETVRPVTLAGKPDDPAVRSDDASALQAFVHAKDLVDRLAAYGWSNPAKYFKAMLPDVRIMYRSGVVPGPGKDGRTVNARVLPQGWPTNAVNGPRRPLYIHVAAADLRRREREAWQPGKPPSAAVPFGLGADRRWLWHEFGHVLLVAATGELEFRFAHSAGDALAAIVADPTSNLRKRARTLTFPFVFLPRYHNRCAHAGWSWTGTQHAALAAVPASKQPRRKGYASEQILSSSLFRLYRCIGGDTFTGRERQRASHYTVYLIMRAMSLMGHARVHIVSKPEEFVDLLIHADRYVAQWPAALPNGPDARTGGTAGKVIRWAFEAQGLYGKGDAVGEPPSVDIYIKDKRPTGDLQEWGGTEFKPGTYLPAPLEWQANAQAPSPLWQSDSDAIARTGVVVAAPGKADVYVGNRGRADAKGVTVQLWMTPWPANPERLHWNDPAAIWTPCGTSNAQDVPMGAASTLFSLPYNPPQGAHILLAIAGCAADRANTDVATGLPCSTKPALVIDLVANDNNIALLVVP